MIDFDLNIEWIFNSIKDGNVTEDKEMFKLSSFRLVNSKGDL